MSQTIIVSNRLPLIVKKTSKGLEYFPGSGGLVSAMKSFTSSKNTTWIGWPGIVSEDLDENDMQEISRKLKTFNCLPVFLTNKEVEDYYSGYSNSILWPLLHNLPADFNGEVKQWKAYRQVNQKFSDSVSSISEPETNIWVHDYQLMLLPSFLRQQANFGRIGFFLHIPFTQPNYLKKLKNHRQIIHGLLGADLVGFHTTKYAEDFLECCDDFNIGSIAKNSVAYKNRVVQVTDFPIGIDYKKYAQKSKTKDVQKIATALRKKYKNRKIIVTVDRLDPTKGFIERLEAYEQFLKESPEFYNKVVMMMLAIPSRGDVKAYQVLKQKVDKLVAKINKEFGTSSWKPIDYLYKSVDFAELSAMYSVADVAFIAPVKDGMNLVAKEYVASQHNKDGALILSETAGASLELKEALLVNPAKQRTLVNALDKALKMPKKELASRISGMQKTISTNTSLTWADGFIDSLISTDKLLNTVNLSVAKSKALVADFNSSAKRLLVFDYDGVLSQFVDDPNQAKPTKQVYEVLKKLSKDPKNDVAIVSGRSSKDLEKWFGKMNIYLGAEHGAIFKPANGKWQSSDESDNDWKQLIKPSLEKYAKATPGAHVEEKQSALVWHYRSASPYYSQKNIAIIKSALGPVLRRNNLKLYMGNKILEIKHPDTNKGECVKELEANKPYDFVMVIGDDYTDEDMFKAVDKKSYTIKVGSGRTNAKFRIATQPRVISLLKNL